MASFDDGIDLEGTTPRLFEDILIDANALSKDSHPDDIQRLAFETQPLSPLQRRRVFETIKRNTESEHRYGYDGLCHRFR